MPGRKNRPDANDTERNGLAVAVFLGAFVLGYLFSALILTALLDGGGQDLPRDSLWKIFVYWCVAIGPQLIGIALGLAATRMAVGRFNRSLLFYIVFGLGLVGVCLNCLFLLFPLTARGILLALLQAGTAWVGFVMLRRGLRSAADR